MYKSISNEIVWLSLSLQTGSSSKTISSISKLTYKLCKWFWIMSDATESWTFPEFCSLSKQMWGKAKVLWEFTESVDFYVSEMFFHLVSKVHTDFRRLVNKFAKTLTKWIQFIFKQTASKIRCKTSELSSNGFSNLGVFCIVYAREFIFVIAFWYYLDYSCSIVVSIARNQVETDFNILLRNNGYQPVDW